MANCIDAVLEKFPEADRKDLEAIYDAMSKERRNGFLDASGNPDAEFMKKAQAMLDNYQRGVKVAELKTLQNILKGEKRKAFIENPAFSSKAEGEQARLTGTFKNVEGGRLSVDYMSKGRANKLIGDFFLSLHESGLPGLKEILRSSELDAKIVAEKWELANGREGGTTRDQNALAIARAWQKFTDSQLVMKNDAGAYINKLEGRVTSRVYDRNLMHTEGEEAFKKFMLENLDYDKSFKRDFHVIDANKAIDDLWTNVMEGKGGTEGSNSDQAVKVIGAPANLARRLEQSRSFHFKNAAAEYEFMQRFGGKTVAEDIAKSAQVTGRQASLMEAYGTNPESAFKASLSKFSPAEQQMLMRHWKAVDGSTSIPGKSPMAQRGATLRKMADMQSLGLSVFAQVPDVATRAGMLQMGGENFFSALGDSIMGFFRNIPKSQREEAVHLFGVGADAHIGEFFDRFGTTEGGAYGWVNKAHQKYFDLTGTKFVTEVNEAATAQQLGARLGLHSDKAFGELNPSYSRVLNKYGIGVPEWEMIRASVLENDGAKMVGWGDVLELEPKVAWDRLKTAGKVSGEFTGNKTQTAFVDRFKRDLSDKLSTYFRDRTDIAMNRAGGFEQAAFTHRGTLEDTVEGQMFRFFGQFKSFSFTMVSKFSKAYYHEVLAGTSNAQKAMNVGGLMTTMAALGYVSLSMRDMAKGKSPPMPTDAGAVAKLSMESLARGGAGGIYGDYLFGEFDSRHGRSALSALAGPVVGKTDDMFDLVNQLKQAGYEADPSKVKLSAFSRFAVNNTVGNMPFVRQGLDYLFLNSMAETLNPGYTERMLQREQEHGQAPIAPWAVGGSE